MSKDIHLPESKERLATHHQPPSFKPRDFLRLVRSLKGKFDDQHPLMPIGTVFEVAYFSPGDSQQESKIFTYHDRRYHEIPVSHVKPVIDS